MEVTGTSEKHHVRVWFGEHVIASYRAERALAERYAQAMHRRFAGLRVTIDPAPPHTPTTGLTARSSS